MMTGTGDCQISDLLRLPSGVDPSIFCSADTCLPRVPIVRLCGRYMRTSSRMVDLIEPVRNSTVTEILRSASEALFSSMMEDNRLRAPIRAFS